jgi:hypothetical protein
MGGGAPRPTIVTPAPEPLISAEEMARKRRINNAKKQGRSKLIVDPAVNTGAEPNNTTGLKIGGY